MEDNRASYNSNLVVCVPINISTRLVVLSLGFFLIISATFAETYELLDPLSTSARVVIPSTFTKTIGNTPSLEPLAVNATSVLSHIDVWCRLPHF